MPRLLRTSERTTFTTCRQRWWWSYVEGYEPKVAAPALRFGTLVHAAFEKYYKPGIKRGPHPAKTFLKLYEEQLEEATKFGFRDEDGKWQEAGELGEALLNAYIDKYGADDEWEVLGSEMTFRVRIAKDLTYVGTLDGVWKSRRNGRILLAEHKTANAIWTHHLPLDEQAGSYWAFAPAALRKKGILGPEENMAGILYNFLRKGKPDDRPTNADGQALNKDGTVSKRQPSPLFERAIVYRDKFDRHMIRGRAIAQAREMEMVRSGELALYKKPSPQICGPCPFRVPCELHETGADYKPIFTDAFIKRDPYASHEIKTEGKE